MINIINSRGNSISTIIIIPKMKKTATRSKTSSTTKRIVSQTLSSHFILQPECQSHIIQVSTISNAWGMSK